MPSPPQSGFCSPALTCKPGCDRGLGGVVQVTGALTGFRVVRSLRLRKVSTLSVSTGLPCCAGSNVSLFHGSLACMQAHTDSAEGFADSTKQRLPIP